MHRMSLLQILALPLAIAAPHLGLFDGLDEATKSTETPKVVHKKTPQIVTVVQPSHTPKRPS